MDQPETMIEARRVGRTVRFFPKRWEPISPQPLRTPRGEYVPLAYDGADPKSFSTFEVAEQCCLRYENPDDSLVAPRWDVDAAEWVERSDEVIHDSDCAQSVSVDADGKILITIGR